MCIEKVIEELKLLYYGYNEDKKVFTSRYDSSAAINEFTKIIDTLDRNSISYEIENMSYIIIKEN